MILCENSFLDISSRTAVNSITSVTDLDTQSMASRQKIELRDIISITKIMCLSLPSINEMLLFHVSSEKPLHLIQIGVGRNVLNTFKRSSHTLTFWS